MVSLSKHSLTESYGSYSVAHYIHPIADGTRRTQLLGPLMANIQQRIDFLAREEEVAGQATRQDECCHQKRGRNGRRTCCRIVTADYSVLALPATRSVGRYPTSRYSCKRRINSVRWQKIKWTQCWSENTPSQRSDLARQRLAATNGYC